MARISKVAFIGFLVVAGCRVTEPDPGYCPDCKADGGDGGSTPDCTKNSECVSAETSQCKNEQCTACTQDSHCSHISGKGVCEDGTCVECTAGKDTACDGKVCNSLTYQCSSELPNTKTVCESCIADEQCQQNQWCVKLSYGDDKVDEGYRCVWNKAGQGGGAPQGNCSNVAPFIANETNITSIDGEQGDVCVLSLTSCTAYEQFRTKSCSGQNSVGHAECGLSGQDDAFCYAFNAEFRCTIPCQSLADDCDTTVSNACVVLSGPTKVCDFGL